MEKNEVKKLIAGRIKDEFRKHERMGVEAWSEIAASKITEQWLEYFKNLNSDCDHENYRSGHSPFVPCICNACGKEL